MDWLISEEFEDPPPIVVELVSGHPPAGGPRIHRMPENGKIWRRPSINYSQHRSILVMAQQDVKLEDISSEIARQHKLPQYTGRRNSALALARRASMADVLAANARRAGSLGDVLLDASNSAASSLQLYLRSLIHPLVPSPSSAHDEHSASSSEEKSSKRKRKKETKAAKRARKSKALGSGSSYAQDGADTTTLAKKKKKRKTKKKKPRRGSVPASATYHHRGSSFSSSTPTPTMAAYLPPPHHQQHPHPPHSHILLDPQPQPQPGGMGAFASFDGCFDADLATLSSGEVELSSSSPRPPTQTVAVVRTAHLPYSAAHAQTVPPSRPRTPPQHQHPQRQQVYQHTMDPPAQQVQMQAASYSHDYPRRYQHQQPPLSASPYLQHPHRQHKQVYPSPQPSPSMPDEWPSLSSLFPQEASWLQPRSPALSMQEQVEHLLCPSLPVSPFNAPPPASPSSGALMPSPAAMPCSNHHHLASLRPLDVPHTHSMPSPSAAGGAPGGVLPEEGIPAASPLSTFFDWADKLLAFDPI